MKPLREKWVHWCIIVHRARYTRHFFAVRIADTTIFLSCLFFTTSTTRSKFATWLWRCILIHVVGCRIHYSVPLRTGRRVGFRGTGAYSDRLDNVALRIAMYVRPLLVFIWDTVGSVVEQIIKISRIDYRLRNRSIGLIAIVLDPITRWTNTKPTRTRSKVERLWINAYVRYAI